MVIILPAFKRPYQLYRIPIRKITTVLIICRKFHARQIWETVLFTDDQVRIYYRNFQLLSNTLDISLRTTAAETASHA